MKGLCCAAQAAGDLGKPLVLTLTHRTGPLAGQTYQKCGVCEVAPSCSDQAKLVFRFRFLPGGTCGIAGAGTCKPTPTGVAQYNAARATLATTPASLDYYVTGTNVLTGRPLPARGTTYSLPLS